MMTRYDGYYFGGPALLREFLQEQPSTVVGGKEDTGVYLALETTVRVLVRCPDRLAQPGESVSPEEFEEPLRQACAEALVGVEAGDFRTEMARVEKFWDAE